MNRVINGIWRGVKFLFPFFAMLAAGILVSFHVKAAPEDNGWSVYRTFEYNIILWEKETR